MATAAFPQIAGLDVLTPCHVIGTGRLGADHRWVAVGAVAWLVAVWSSLQRRRRHAKEPGGLRDRVEFAIEHGDEHYTTSLGAHAGHP